jgi:hypothetical protein
MAYHNTLTFSSALPIWPNRIYLLSNFNHVFLKGEKYLLKVWWLLPVNWSSSLWRKSVPPHHSHAAPYAGLKILLLPEFDDVTYNWYSFLSLVTYKWWSSHRTSFLRFMFLLFTPLDIWLEDSIFLLFTVFCCNKHHGIEYEL